MNLFFQNLIGGIVGAKTAILSPVLNIVKGIKGGILGVAGGILQAKGNLLSSKGAALQSLAQSLQGSGGIGGLGGIGGGINFGIGGGNGGMLCFIVLLGIHMYLCIRFLWTPTIQWRSWYW